MPSLSHALVCCDKLLLTLSLTLSVSFSLVTFWCLGHAILFIQPPTLMFASSKLSSNLQPSNNHSTLSCSSAQSHVSKNSRHGLAMASYLQFFTFCSCIMTFTLYSFQASFQLITTFGFNTSQLSSFRKSNFDWSRAIIITIPCHILYNPVPWHGCEVAPRANRIWWNGSL